MRIGAAVRLSGAGIFALVVLHAQNAASPAATPSTTELATHDPAPAPIFHAATNLVLAPVVVRDSRGHAIGTLRKEDFRLFDQGQPQVISTFSVERPEDQAIITSQAVETDAGGHPITRANAPAAGPIATRFAAWLFDDVHLPFADLARAREAAQWQFKSLEPGARAAIFTTSGHTWLDFTDDRDTLLKTLALLRPSPTLTVPDGACPHITYYEADRILNANDYAALEAAKEEYLQCGTIPPRISAQEALSLAEPIVKGQARNILNMGGRDTRMALSTLKNLVRRMGVLPGSRTIVLISPGFLLTNDHRSEESEVMDRAIRANVVISSLDARGLYVIIPGGDASTPTAVTPDFRGLKTRNASASASANEDVMADLAAATGGTFFHNGNDLGEGLGRIAAPPEFLYVLGFSPHNLKADNRFHPLKVTVTGGYQVQARRGYFAGQPAVEPADREKHDIEEALVSRAEIHDLPVELFAQFFKVGDKVRIEIFARVDVKLIRLRKVDGRSTNKLALVGGVFDYNGNYVTSIEKSVELRLKDETLETPPKSGVLFKWHVDVAPGNYVVRMIARDSEGQMMSARNSVVQIP